MERTKLVAITSFTFVFVCGIATGGLINTLLFPQNPVKEIEVEKIIEQRVEVPTPLTKKYDHCLQRVHQTYFSSWDGDIKEGVTTSDVEAFINQCLENVE